MAGWKVLEPGCALAQRAHDTSIRMTESVIHPLEHPLENAGPAPVPAGSPVR
jgi:hypothetical protein